jgi:hypothetical protein
MEDAFTSFYVPNAAAHKAVMDALSANVLVAQRLPSEGASITKKVDNASLKKHSKFLTHDLTAADGPVKGAKMVSLQGFLVPYRDSAKKVNTTGMGKAAKATMWKSVQATCKQ